MSERDIAAQCRCLLAGLILPGLSCTPVAAQMQAVQLEKETNGQDADLPPGPILTVGDPVNWSYTARSPTSARSRCPTSW